MRRYLLFTCALLCFLTSIKSQDTEFWFAAPDVAETHSDRPVYFAFSNPNKNVVAHVRFTVQGGVASPGAAFDTTFTLPVGGYTKIEFVDAHATRQVSMVENPDRLAGNPADYGIHITSDTKIMAYYKMDGDHQRDIYVFKGKPALGTYFITPFHEQVGNYYKQTAGGMYDMGADQIDIVATENNTNVTVNLTKDCLQGIGGLKLLASASPHYFTLNKGQTLKLREDTTASTILGSTHDQIADTKNTGTLAGTIITSDLPIAVTQSEDCITPIQNPGAADLAGDQLVPVDMLGKRYVVTRVKYTAIDERVDFVATKPNTTITVHYFDGSNNPLTTTSPTLNAGDKWHIAMNNLPGGHSSNIFVDASEPVYCFQHAGGGNSGTELSGALIPSMYAIGNKRIDFYQSETINYGYLVYRAGEDTAFYLSVNGGPEFNLPSVYTSGYPAFYQEKGPLPFTPDWEYMIIQFSSSGTNNKMVTVRNDNSPFSLAVLNAHSSHGVASFGYLSGFGDWKFEPDTVWLCGSGGKTRLMGGYALDYEWTLPDGSIRTTPSITTSQYGMYILKMNQDPKILIDTCYVYPMTFEATAGRVRPSANKPIKVGVPQHFEVSVGAGRSTLNYLWNFQGGTPATSTSATPSVTWNSTGLRKVTLTISAEEGTGEYLAQCDTTIEMEYMVKPRYNGYFVNERATGILHDGSSWSNAFYTIQEALDVASQGDYIWVAEGEYSPWTDQSYVMDYDSVMVYGGFKGNETSLSERNFSAHPTILKGNGATVIKIDGGTTYSSGFCGTSRAAGWDGFTIQDGNAQKGINGSDGNGGGILFINGAKATIANCIIKNNTAAENGGGMYVEHSGTCISAVAPSFFYNTEISGNRATTGGGVFNEGDASFLNVTIAGNSANKASGFMNANGNPTVYNSIIWGNGKEGNDVVTTGGIPEYAYSVVGGSKGSGIWNQDLGTDGGNNLDASPLFKRKGYDEQGNMQEGNYRLSISSNSLNTGQSRFVLMGHSILQDIELESPVEGTYAISVPNDLAGRERVFDVVERGAYEYIEDDNNTDPKIKHQVRINVYNGVTSSIPAGVYHAASQSDFVITFSPESGYSLEYVKVTTGSIWMDEQGGLKVVHNTNGSITVTCQRVTSPLDIILTNISPVGNDSVDKTAIWTRKNNLYVKTSEDCLLKIYTLNGELFKEQILQSGTTNLTLPQGIYIVTLDNGTTQKIVIN